MSGKMYFSVDAQRVDIVHEDLLEYKGNPINAPIGRIHMGPANTGAAIKEVTASLLRPFGGLPAAPKLWMTALGDFTLKEEHAHQSTLNAMLDIVKRQYSGDEVIFLSWPGSGGSVNTLIRAEGRQFVFVETKHLPVNFKYSDEDRGWKVFNRTTETWETFLIDISVVGHFVMGDGPLQLTVKGVVGDEREYLLHIDKDGWVQEVNSVHNGELRSVSTFQVADSNKIFDFIKSAE